MEMSSNSCPWFTELHSAPFFSAPVLTPAIEYLSISELPILSPAFCNLTVFCLTHPCLFFFFNQVIQSPFLWLYLLAFLYSFFFPRTLHALVSGVPFLISAVDLFSVASQSFLPVEISAWNENMLAMQSCMEIYNVLLYGEISHLQILFFSNLSWLLFFPLYSTTWSLESFCHVQRKKSNWNFNWKCIKLINLAMIAFYF